MPKDSAYKGQQPRALAGVASVLASASAPSAMAGANLGGVVVCDVCGLQLPRDASHRDVASHPCYRGFTISLTAAGQISLA